MLGAVRGARFESPAEGVLPCGSLSRRVHSGILRDMSILGYLGQLQSPDVGAVLPLNSLVPYQVKE